MHTHMCSYKLYYSQTLASNILTLTIITIPVLFYEGKN